MIISLFDTAEDERLVFTSLLTGHTLSFHKESLTKQNAAGAEETDVLYVRSFSHVTADILRSLPKLKFIATRSTGFDNIDLDYCKKRRIVVSNVPSYAVDAVTEHTFGLLLSLSHNIVSCVQKTRTGSFFEGPQGFEISGKTIGIIGLGNIGSRVAQIAKGFGMHVLVTTKHPTQVRARKYGVTFVDFPTLLQKSDVVSFHVPLTEETFHMLNINTIASLKHGNILINTSRGEVIETKAIVWALQHGILYGAGLDVLENERGLKEFAGKRLTESDITALNHKLMTDQRVLVTPHNAYHTKEAIDTILRISAENIIAFLKKKPINRVV